MDYYTILAQCAKLKSDFTGRKLDAVRLFETYTVYLGFEIDRALKLSSIPGMPYLVEVEKRYLPVRNARDWHMRKFAGSTLESVEITPGDRILTFAFSSGYRLIFEMTGRHANIVLVDSENITVEAVRKVTARQSGFRTVRSGAPYAAPPARDYPDPIWTPFQTLKRRLIKSESGLAAALADTVCCGSRLCAREAVARAKLDPDCSPGELSEDELLRLLKCTAEIVGAVERGGEGGTVVFSGDGLPRDVFPLKMSTAASVDVHYDDLNEAVVKYSLVRERGLEKAELKKNVAAVLSREEKSLKNTRKKVERERGESLEPDELERAGNTVLANLHLLGKGKSSVTLPDPYDGGDIDIEIDPTLDGPANAERFFTRARKFREAAKRAEERIAGIDSRLEEVRREREHLDTVEDVRELKKLAAAHARSSSRDRASDFDRPFPRRFTSVSGLEIIVGRNDKENDELVRWAKKNDFWLHAQGVGGSHVVLRTPSKNQQPDRRSIEQAAAVAAHYSKAKTSAVVPVVCTKVKYVIKRRGQGPGQVTYTREKVVFAEPGLPGVKE